VRCLVVCLAKQPQKMVSRKERLLSNPIEIDRPVITTPPRYGVQSLPLMRAIVEYGRSTLPSELV
jgi:hypothetical protein